MFKNVKVRTGVAGAAARVRATPEILAVAGVGEMRRR